MRDTSRLSRIARRTPSWSTVRTVVFAVLIVVSAMAAPVAFNVSPVQNATAAGTNVDDFEDGDVAEWSSWTKGGATTAKSFEGSYSGDLDAAGAKQTASYNIGSEVAMDNMSFKVNSAEMSDGAYPLFQTRNSGGSNVMHLEGNNGELIGRDGTTDISTGIPLKDNTWYEIYVQFDYANNQYDVTVWNKSGSKVGSYAGLPFDNAASGMKEIKFHAYDFSTYIDDVEYNKPADSATSDVSGTVTDSDGNAISGATVETGTGKSTTTASDGSYTLTLGDGTYDITASKSGYLSQTNTVEVSGSAVTGNNYSLAENAVAGTVTNQNGDPVANATVRIAAINYSHPDIDAPTDSETEQNAEDYLNDLVPDIPTGLQDQRSSSFSLTGSTGFIAQQDSTVGLLHSRDDLNTAQLSVMPDSADLSNPQWQGINPNERQVVTCWDPTQTGGLGGTGIGQNEYNTQNPGTHQSDCTVEFTQLAGVDDVNTVSVEMNQTSRTTTFDPSTLHYGMVSLPAGWYRVSTSESDASYVIQVGDPTQAIYEGLKNSQGTNIPSVAEVNSGLSDNKFVMKTAVTDANGKFSLQVDDSNLKTVGIQAYKAPGVDISPSNLRLSDVRSAANANNLNESVYLPSRVYVKDVPSSGTTVRMTEASWAAYGNLSEFQSRWQALLDAIENGEWSNLPPAMQQRLDNVSRDSLEDTFTEMDDLRKRNQRLEDAYERALERNGGDTTVNIDPNEASRDDLERRIQALQQSMTQLQSDIDSGEPSVSTDNETVSLTFPFDTDLSKENVLVRAHFNNGTSRTLNTSSDYVSIDQRIGGDAVKITDYPLGSGDAALADFEVDVATSDGTGSSSRAVTNPTFSGDVPSLSSVEFSTLRPGPDELVSVDVHPEDVGKFDQLTSATVYGPDGSQISTTTITDDSFEFTTNGVGKHRVELTFTNPGGVEFTEIVYLGAGKQDQNWPASVRAASGPTGIFALVGDGLEAGSIDVKQGGTEVDISATIPQKADAPTDLHVYTEALETAPDTTTRVSVVRGDQESSIQKHIPVTVHGPTIDDNALIYRNDEPLPRGDGNQYGVVKVKGNQTVYKTITNEQGTVSLRVSADPGLLERAQHWVSLRAPDISLPGMSIFPGGSSTPALGGIALVGFAVVSRRRFL